MSGLTAGQRSRTGAWIASVQEPDGMIPWFPGGHADPWNHVEAAMALAATGRVGEAERAYRWLRSTQLEDGSWCLYHLVGGIEDPRRDPNVCAYLATGLWWHWLLTGDRGLAEEMWPVVDRAVAWVLALQRPGGEVAWSMDADGRQGRFALLTSTASISHSLRCAAELADLVGHDRPAWRVAAARAARAVAEHPEAFLAKDRWAMDWYYPVLCGTVPPDVGRRRLDERWDRFVMDGVGVRCVDDHPWVTAAETAECAIAHHAAGLTSRAATLLAATDHLRDDDGAYWTGCVHPECVRYPGGERSTYTAAAVVLADHVLHHRSPAADVFGVTGPEDGRARSLLGAETD